MKYFGISILLFLAFLATPNEGYRILCVFPFNGRSHFMMFDALCKGLARKGHQIDMISHFPLKTPRANYTDIVDLSGTRENVVNSFSVEFAKTLHGSITYHIGQTYGYEICKLMGTEKMQEFIKNPPRDPPYDLVITEYFGSACYIGLGKYLKVPVVVAVSSMEPPYLAEIMGNPLNYAFYSGIFFDTPVIKTFWDRFWNFVINYTQKQLFYHYTTDQTEIMRHFLGQDLPNIRDVEKSVALALVNTHYSFHGSRPITPAIVEVGGIHVQEDESKLSPELKTWLDSAKDGVVYFTLGSLINIETLPTKTMLDLYKSFGKIAPVKVLMKCADKTKLPPGLPSNVLTSSWIPQIPVLRHKNVRVFITHGGLMGSQEALYYGVPMIGIPVFADQMKNVNIFVEKNMAVSIEIDKINERTMDAALDALLNDPKYREAAKKHSILFTERPMSAMDTAIYWVEYIMRNGPNSLRSPAMDMPWWQIELIDILAFITSCVLLLIYILAITFRFVLRKVRKETPTDRKKRD